MSLRATVSGGRGLQIEQVHVTFFDDGSDCPDRLWQRSVEAPHRMAGDRHAERLVERLQPVELVQCRTFPPFGVEIRQRVGNPLGLRDRAARYLISYSMSPQIFEQQQAPARILVERAEIAARRAQLDVGRNLFIKAHLGPVRLGDELAELDFGRMELGDHRHGSAWVAPVVFEDDSIEAAEVALADGRRIDSHRPYGRFGYDPGIAQRLGQPTGSQFLRSVGNVHFGQDAVTSGSEAGRRSSMRLNFERVWLYSAGGRVKFEIGVI